MNRFLVILAMVLLSCCHYFKSLLVAFLPRRFRRRKDITGQKVLVTGAGSGLGRQLAIELSKQSVCLILLDIDKPALLVTEKLLERRSTVFLYHCDVSSPEQVYQVAEKIKNEAGDVDILINNAGVVSGRPLLELSDANIVRTMEVNALSHFWTCKAFLPAMMSKNRGHIVSVTSLVAKAGAPKLTDYVASKYAALGFAEALEMELRLQQKDGIKVTIVCPSLMDTGLFRGATLKISTILSPEYVAKEVAQAILEEKELIFVPAWLKMMIIFKELMPRWILLWGFEKTGDIRGMESFTGRNGMDPKKVA